MLTPGDSDVEVPIIDRKNVQIMSLNGKVAQVMDSSNYEMYDLEIPEDMLAQAAPGKEAEVIEAMGKRKIERIR
jgi:translation initiation factor 5A